MYTGTRFKWIDKSSIDSIKTIETPVYQPFLCTAAAFAKGPEEWTVTSGQEFFDLYGEPNFAKYGQANVQAAQCIQAGAKMLVKRVVANDATMANLAIYAKVDIVGSNSATVTFISRSFEGVKSLKPTSILADALAEKDKIAAANSGSDIYLFYIFSDIGRGESAKRINIECNYTLSKTSNYPIYRFTVTDNGTTLGTYAFTLNPSQSADGSNISLGGIVESSCPHVAIYQNDDDIAEYINTIMNITGITSLKDYDVLFGCTAAGTGWNGLSLNTSDDSVTGVINLKSSTGIKLVNGSNGCFGDSPLSETSITVKDEDEVTEITTSPFNLYTTALVEAFDGTFDDRIFNVDRYKFEAIFDANYPRTVKQAISRLAIFREDFFFFRDIGLGKDTADEIITAVTSIYNGTDTIEHSKFISIYCQDYCVRDPYSYKRVQVTSTYTLCRKVIALFTNGHHLPIAGIRNNMIIDDIVTDTLNFNPVVTPIVNQKELLDDARVNYASYIGEDLVYETEYTSQNPFTQLSYNNNVLLVQQVIREIRERCPRIRYAFITDADLTTYQDDVNEVIDEYKRYFNTITFKYMADAAYENNKIFYATIEFSFNNFVQTEYFEIVAINTEAITTES